MNHLIQEALELLEANWSADVKTKWEAPEGLFSTKAENIVKVLRANSKDDSQAMKRLVFYMNRAGENVRNKLELNRAKEMLREK